MKWQILKTIFGTIFYPAKAGIHITKIHVYPDTVFTSHYAKISAVFAAFAFIIQRKCLRRKGLSSLRPQTVASGTNSDKVGIQPDKQCINMSI